MIKKILIGLVAVFVIIQFFHPEKNQSNDQTYYVSRKYVYPTDVDQILKAACLDCHSNKTEYPWYSNIQPVAWWLNHHVDEGKHELNFSTFLSRKVAIQNHKLEEIIEQVEKGEMPLASYTYLGMHPEANLSTEQKTTLINWAKAQMDTLKANYPADSLILKRPSGPPPAK
jgi:Haem-binding domain